MITLSERFLRLRCSTNQNLVFLQNFNLRHKNRLTMYCYKSRFRRYFGISGIKDNELSLIPTSSNMRARHTSLKLCATPKLSALCLKIWWVRKNSNLRPPLYQSGILTNWTTDPEGFRCTKLLSNSSADTRIIFKKRYSDSRIWVTIFVKMVFSIKEVIQPHLPVLLPCYDLTPITNPTVGGVPLR